MEYRGFTLDPFQAEAIEHLAAGRSVLVSAPTGTGKTIIADYVVEQALAEGRHVVYTAPIKALSNQKYRDYTRLYGREPIGLVTGDLVINQDAPIRIMTTEILRNILLQQGAPEALSHVIVDEIHFLDDPERGTVWEELLIYLPAKVKILGLSATLSNIDEFSHWLSTVRGEPVPVVKEERRAVPLKVMLANRSSGMVDIDEFLKRQKAQHKERTEEADEWVAKGRRGRPAGRAGFRVHDAAHGPPTLHLDMVRMLDPDYLPILYFVFSRRQTESFARELGRRIRQSFLSPKQRAEVQAALDAFDRDQLGVLTDLHKDLYLKGIAFHHAGLHVHLKALVEDLYEKRLVQVLYCTSTFAMGLNMPARTVVFDSIRKFDGHEVKPLTVRQFMQKAGRAGRRGLDKVGFVLIREPFEAFPEDEPFIRRFIRGRHERIDSAFNLSFSSIVNLLHRHSESEIRDILDKSFLNFRNRAAIDREKAQLEEVRAELEEQQRAGAVRDTKKTEKRLRRMERDLSGAEGRLYDDLQRKLDFLKKAGYIDESNGFNAGARALMHVQIEEIFVSELILSGILEDVNEDELFGIFTGVVQELPRGVSVYGRPSPRWGELRDRIRAIREGEIVTAAEGLQSSPTHFSPELMPLGEMWARGDSLAAIMLRIRSEIDISGDLVGAFRRAKDLATQVRDAFRGYDLMTERLAHLTRKVSRDEVEVLD